ncbi:MAG: hypothetical protein JO101_03310, partial [Candidatus Eremiobacteraeota bacterium]|nr:hypothetical protein [Candidatus Eremiobacteraeota bacterium]
MEAAISAETAGAKAFALGRALRDGLPVLPGFVVPVSCAQNALAAGRAELERFGSGGARLATSQANLDPALSSEIAARARALGPSLVVRSSSPLEGSGRWSGAFASYVGVAPAHLDVAVRGVWASIFSRNVLERCGAEGVQPGSIGIAVLIQPAVAFEAGGIARREHSGRLRIEAVRGAPSEIVSGWAAGVELLVDDGRIQARERHDFPTEMVLEIAALTRAVGTSYRHDLIEWGWSPQTGLILLQTQRDRETMYASRTAVRDAAHAPDGSVRCSAEPLVGGVGAGRGLFLRMPQGEVRVADRPVLVVPRPLAAFAPLMWNVAGLVSLSGG